MSQSPSTVPAEVIDAAGAHATVLADDGESVQLRWPDGTELTVPSHFLRTREDGTRLLPLVLHADGAVRMPVMQEQLQVDKRVVDTGGVRIHKRVHTHEEEAALALMQEDLQVERVPIGKPVEDGSAPRMREEGDTIVIPVLEERLVVSKQLVLKEELRVTRTRTPRHESHTEVLRSEEVEVERFAEQPRRDV